MSITDSEFGFDAVFRKSAAELQLRLARDAASRTFPAASHEQRGGVAALSVFVGLGLLSVGIFVVGYSALLSDSPEIWIHRLMALAITQSALIGIVTMKLLPIIERRRSLSRIKAYALRTPPVESPRHTSSSRSEPAPPPLPPREPVVGGQLAGRDYLRYDDGSIEIDTLVGRRRFVSIEAARDFVGS